VGYVFTSDATTKDKIIEIVRYYLHGEGIKSNMNLLDWEEDLEDKYNLDDIDNTMIICIIEDAFKIEIEDENIPSPFSINALVKCVDDRKRK